jgi:hypothetical protein
VDNAVPRADGTGGVTAQGSAISIDDATTSTQANVAIVNAHSETNSSLVLSPKGTGAFILGPKPDGTATGGNARGTRSVDLQLSRDFGGGSATAVCTGTNSIICCGNKNTNSGSTSAVVSGRLNSISGGDDVVVGGYFNSVSAGIAAMCLSRESLVNAGAAGVFAGRSNQATGTCAVVLGGGQTSDGPTIRNVASGTAAAVVGGTAGVADRWSMHAHSGGRFAADGDAQRARFVLRNKTTTNAAVELFLDGSATRLTIPSGKYLTGTINIAGIKSDGATAARYIRQFSIKNVAATTSLVGTVDTVGTDIANSTTISITADDTNDALKVEVTGIASETWRWVAAVDVVEVAYGS